MAVVYCGKCGKALTPNDRRARRSTHYHCAPQIRRVLVCGICGDPSVFTDEEGGKCEVHRKIDESVVQVDA